MRSLVRGLSFISTLALLSVPGCGDDEGGTPAADPPVALVFDLDADLTEAGRFFSQPWPSDLRLDAEGRPDLAGFPKPDTATILEGLLEIAAQRKGWPVIPFAYFEFDGELPELDLNAPIPAEISSDILLVDIDPDSPERGQLVPTVATVPPEDAYINGTTLAVAARPGFVLMPERTYAFVVKRSLGTADGEPLGNNATFESLKPGGSPTGAAAEAASVYAPLWDTLDELGVPASDVVAANVFTTADVVAETHELSDGLMAKHTIAIDNLALDPDDGADHDRFCELHGSVTYPQFQRGTQPFGEDGLFVFGADGLPEQQGEIVAPIVISIPKEPMPDGGYPLTLYFHGSGGLSNQVVDRGTVFVPEGEPEKGKGPSHVLAARGFAMAGSALPVNPERLPGADSLAYLNFDNPKAFRDTFRQGVIEQRMFIEALRTLTIDPTVLEGCVGPELPVGETSFRFAEQRLTAMGQSMGGMYTNMIGATEPRIEAVVPTGAGGYWGYFILETSLVPGAGSLLAILVDTKQTLSFVHPSLSLLTLAWESAEPMVYMPRLARRPLEGHPARPIYQPAGRGDTFFPTQVYDAMTLAYGHQQAGSEIWETMQPALSLAGLNGLLSYPIEGNRTSASGESYTGVVVQYEGDGIYDPHAIAFQLDDVKYQYSCFLQSFVQSGTAQLFSGGVEGAPCQ